MPVDAATGIDRGGAKRENKKKEAKDNDELMQPRDGKGIERVWVWSRSRLQPTSVSDGRD